MSTSLCFQLDTDAFLMNNQIPDFESEPRSLRHSDSKNPSVKSSGKLSFVFDDSPNGIRVWLSMFLFILAECYHYGKSCLLLHFSFFCSLSSDFLLLLLLLLVLLLLFLLLCVCVLICVLLFYFILCQFHGFNFFSSLRLFIDLVE